MTRRCVIERWVHEKLTKNWFSIRNYTQIVFFVFRIHFHYVLSYLFGLFGVRTYVSILWHTSLPKNATFAWKNSEKPWFWRFLVIFVFLTWCHLRRHCGVIQGMLYFYLPTDSGGSKLSISTTHLMFRQSVSEILGGRNPPPGCEMGPKSPALLGLRHTQLHQKLNNQDHTYHTKAFSLQTKFNKKGKEREMITFRNLFQHYLTFCCPPQPPLLLVAYLYVGVHMKMLTTGY